MILHAGRRVSLQELRSTYLSTLTQINQLIHHDLVLRASYVLKMQA